MAIEIISTIKPKNNGSFPIAEAKDIDVGGTRLDTKLEELANNSGGCIIDVAELPTEGIDESALYRVPVGTMVFNDYVQPTKVYCVEDVQSLEGGQAVTTDMQNLDAVYYNVAEQKLYMYADETLSAATSGAIAVGFHAFETFVASLGYSYGGVIVEATDATASNTFYLLLEYKTYYYKNRWFCTTKEIISLLADTTSEQQTLSDDDYAKIKNDYNNIVIYFVINGVVLPLHFSYHRSDEICFSNFYNPSTGATMFTTLAIDTSKKTATYYAAGGN